MAYHQLLYHIVFSTKYRQPVINPLLDHHLFRYIWGISQNLDSKLYRINGIQDHIHILVSIHPALALSEYVKRVKVASSIWMKDSDMFPAFIGWQASYGAFTVTLRHKDMIINYIKNQKTHHKNESSYNEFGRLLLENNIAFDSQYLQ